MGTAGRGVGAAAIAVMVLTVLAACGPKATSSGPDAATSGCTSGGTVTSAAATRPATRLGPPGGIPALQGESRTVAQARTLYRAACRLVAVNYHLPPNTAINCPADFGLVYHIVFSNQHGSLATAKYEASGCESLSMELAPGGHRSTMILGARAPALRGPFDAALAAVLEVPVATLHGPS